MARGTVQSLKAEDALTVSLVAEVDGRVAGQIVDPGENTSDTGCNQEINPPMKTCRSRLNRSQEHHYSKDNEDCVGQPGAQNGLEGALVAKGLPEPGEREEDEGQQNGRGNTC